MNLAQMGRGFESPVHGAQLTFRAVLEAMSRPGSQQTLPTPASRGLQVPGIGAALTAVLLTLLDAETRLHLGPGMPGQALADYLRFHTRTRLLAEAEPLTQADFVVIHSSHAEASWWGQLQAGTDEQPQQGATLVVEVASLSADPSTPDALVLRGPGIAHTQQVSVGGVRSSFWQARIDMQAQFPRGVDLILCCGDALMAIPRSTQIQQRV